MKLANCRSCNAPIVWAKSEKGHNLPLDAKVVAANDPRVTARSTLFVIDAADPPNAKSFPSSALIPTEDRGPVYLSHFATCPHAGEHSRRRR